MDVSNRYYSLDLLKFVLSIFIVFHHFQQDTAIFFRHINFYGGIFNFAYCVELFFMISGFLAMIRKKNVQDSSFKEYLYNKIRRFFPMSALSVTVMLMLQTVYYLINGIWYNGLKPDIYKVFNSFLLTFSGGSILCGRGINNPLWFLSVLIKCQIILWLILKLCKKYNWDPVYLSIFMISIGTAIISYEIDLPFFNEEAGRGYAGFFLGTVLYGFYQNVDQKRTSVLSCLIFAVCFCLGLIDHSTFYEYEWGAYTFVLLPYILIIALSFERLLRKNFISTLGKVSFEVYIWHAPFIYLMEILFSLMPGLKEGIEPHLLMAVFTMTVLACSFLMHHFVEKKAEGAFVNMIRFFKGESEKAS